MKPIVNNWYTNLTGRLMKVRLITYDSDMISSVVVEYITKETQIINSVDWDSLTLTVFNKARGTI